MVREAGMVHRGGPARNAATRMPARPRTRSHAVLGGVRSYFSVRTGTALQRSKVPLRKVGVRDVHRDHQHEERVQHEAPGGVGPQEVE